MSRRKRRRRHRRWTRRRGRPRCIPQDDPGRDDQLRWQRQAGDVIAALEPENAAQVKLRRLLISLASFLEPGCRRRLGVEGAWGVFRAFRELAEQGIPDSRPRFERRRPAGSGDERTLAPPTDRPGKASP